MSTHIMNAVLLYAVKELGLVLVNRNLTGMRFLLQNYQFEPFFAPLFILQSDTYARGDHNMALH